MSKSEKLMVWILRKKVEMLGRPFMNWILRRRKFDEMGLRKQVSKKEKALIKSDLLD